MRRPSHPLNPELKGLTYNPKSCLYEISENGITYAIPLELTRLLKTFVRSGTIPPGEALLASWYKSLDKANKRLIKREGNIPDLVTDFYPDPEFD